MISPSKIKRCKECDPCSAQIAFRKNNFIPQSPYCGPACKPQEKQDGLPCKTIVFSNSSRIRRKRKFYYIIFFGVCVGGFKNFFGFLEIWCEMLEMEGRGGADAAQSVFTNYVKSADTAQPVPTSIYCIHEKATCRNEMSSEPLPHKADPTEHSWRGVLWCCKDRLCRVRWFYVKAHSVGNVPPERFQNIGSVNGTQGGAVLFAPPSKSYRFSHPPSPCARSMGTGNFAVCGQRLRRLFAS